MSMFSSIRSALGSRRNSADDPPVRTINGYKILKTLGTGLTAKVKLGEDTDGNLYALKCMHKDCINDNQMIRLEIELEAMESVKGHENVVTMVSVDRNAKYPKKRGGTRDIILLVLELANGGELFDYLMYTGGFDENVAKTYTHQLISALKYCHDLDVFHRDIKPENILLSGDFKIQVADFGLSSIQGDSDSAGVCSTCCGTREYMSPEVIEDIGGVYDPRAADIWSLGVVIFIMIAGTPPFSTATPTDWWYRAISAGKMKRFWAAHTREGACPNFPKGAMKFLTKIFKTDPTERASLEQLLADPWLQDGIIGEDDLGNEMKRKLECVEQAKAKELQAAKKKKAAAKKQTSKESKNGIFSRKHRAGGEMSTPPVINGSGLFYNFLSMEDPAQILAHLTDTVIDLGVTEDDLKANVEEWKLKATFRPEGKTPLTLVANVYACPHEDDGSSEPLYMLTFEKRKGDPVFFFNIVNAQIAVAESMAELFLKDDVQEDDDQENCAGEGDVKQNDASENGAEEDP